MRDVADLTKALEKAAAKAGKGKPLGIGTEFWLDVRWHLKEMRVKPETMKGHLKNKRIGEWRGRNLYIIPGNIDAMFKSKPGMNEPRPWSEVKK